MFRIRILLCIILSAPLFSLAQKKYSSSDSRAIRYLESAVQAYDSREDQKAIEFLNEAIKSDPAFVEAYLMKASILTDKRQWPQSIDAYRTSLSINPDFFPNAFYLLGKLEYYTGEYDSAIVHLQRYMDHSGATANLKTNARRYLESSRFAQQAIRNPVEFSPQNMGQSINSADQEYFPAITADGNTFLFTRRIKTAQANGRSNEQEDFFISNLDKNAWTKAMPLTEINTSGNEGAPTLSADGQYLFFTACEELFAETDARPTKGSCDLFIAKKVGDRFVKPRNLEEPVNTGAWESQPSFSSDGRTLYFVRAIKGSDGRKQRDIYVTRIDDFSNWSAPQPLGATINTAFDETSVFIHPDDQTLYFSSDGHPGMGGQDIFVSRRQPDGQWGAPVNLGYPINTSDDENSLLVSPDGTTGYFASDRSGGYGGLDLYSFSLNADMRPRVVTYMKGKVFDSDTRKPLGAGFELIDLSTGKSVVNSTSNPGNGEFIVCLPTGKSYALNVSKDGYLFYSENFELKDFGSVSKPVMRDVPLKPIKVGETVVLKNIFFDFNKAELKDESKVELDKVVAFMKKNPSLRIEIGGHTDNIGGKAYNLQLSEKRAASVSTYVTSHGISADRLTNKGYGDAMPVADNTSESGRAQNRRTEFKIISLN